MNDKEIHALGLRAYTLIKELRSKSDELEIIRARVAELLEAGSDVYISTRQKERVVLGDSFNRSVDAAILGDIAANLPDLRAELELLALNKMYDITVGQFNALLIHHPEIAAALYMKSKKPSLSIKPLKQ